MSTETTPAPAGAPASGAPTVTFAEDAKACQSTVGLTIRKVAQANGVAIQTGTAAWANCRGFGLCGTCRVNVDPAASVSAPSFWERFTLGKDCGKMRLACQTKVAGDVTVKLKPARDYSEVFHNVVFQSAMIGAFSLAMLAFMVVMLLDIVGIRF